MRTLLQFLIAFVLVAGAYRLLASLIVKDKAEVILADDACPVSRAVINPGKPCVLTGSISTDFVSGDMLVVTANNTTWLIPQAQVRGVAYSVGASRYEVQLRAAIIFLGLVGLAAYAVLPWGEVHRGSPKN